MSKKIEKTRKRAIKRGRQLLRDMHPNANLMYAKIENTSTECACGTTRAIKYIAKMDEQWDWVVVGFCTNCYQDYE